MNGEFNKQYIVKYHDCSNNDLIDFGQLIRYAQETSTLHAEDLGCGIEYLNENKCGWILLENHCKVNRYPKVGEKFNVRTWVNSMDRIYAIRHYEIKDMQDNVILQSYTKWIIYSFERKRPIKIPSEVNDMFIFSTEKTINIDNIEFKKEEIDNIKTVNGIVRYKDIDTNWHMNNVSYINTVMETMGKDFLDLHEVCECKVEYRHQLLYNVEFEVNINKLNEFEYIYGIKQVYDENEKCLKGNNANVYLKWRRKSESDN